MNRLHQMQFSLLPPTARSAADVVQVSQQGCLCPPIRPVRALCPLMDMRSMFIAFTSSGILPTACAASVWKKTCGEEPGDAKPSSRWRRGSPTKRSSYARSGHAQRCGQATRLPLAADLANLGNRLHDADLIVHGHDGHEGGVRADLRLSVEWREQRARGGGAQCSAVAAPRRLAVIICRTCALFAGSGRRLLRRGIASQLFSRAP